MFEDNEAVHCLSVLCELFILSTRHSQDPKVMFLDCIFMTQLSQICINKVFFEVTDLILVWIFVAFGNQRWQVTASLRCKITDNALETQTDLLLIKYNDQNKSNIYLLGFNKIEL